MKNSITVVYYLVSIGVASATAVTTATKPFDLPFTASAFAATDHQVDDAFLDNGAQGNCDPSPPGFDAQQTLNDPICQAVSECYLI